MLGHGDLGSGPLKTRIPEPRSCKTWEMSIILFCGLFSSGSIYCCHVIYGPGESHKTSGAVADGSRLLKKTRWNLGIFILHIQRPSLNLNTG